MPSFIRKTTMIPFLELKAGEFWVVRCNGLEEITIKGQPTPVISLDIYFAGRLGDSGIPPADKCALHLNNASTPVYTGQNKSLMDAMFPENKKDDIGTGKYFVVAYYGQKQIGGGRKFNMFEVLELVP